MDALKAIVGAGCGTDGVVSAQNPLMTAVDAGLQQLLWTTSGVASIRTSESTLRPGLGFTLPSPGYPTSSAVEHAAQSQLERAWAASASPQPLAAPSQFLTSQYTQQPRWIEPHAPQVIGRPHAYQSQSYGLSNSSVPARAHNALPSAHDAALLVPSVAGDSEALEAEYARSMAVMTGHEASTHARTVVAALERAAETNANIRNSEFLGFMKEVQDGRVDLCDNRLVTAGAGNSVSCDLDMPTAEEITRRVNTIENMWRRALLHSNDAEAVSMAGLGTHGAADLDIDDVWRQASAVRELHASGNFGAPGTIEEHAMRQHRYVQGDAFDDDGAVADLVEQAWADVNNDLLSHFAESSADPLTSTSAGSTDRSYELGEADKNEVLQEYHTTYERAQSAERSRVLSAMLECGDELFAHGSMTDAMRVFEAVLHLAPETAAAWLRLGQCHAEIDDDKSAIACFERAHGGDPYNLDALLALGVSYINERDNDKAFTVLQSWVEHHPLLQGVRASGDAYSDGSLADSVMQLMLEADTRVHNDPNVATVLGVLYNASGDCDLALVAFQRALSASDGDHSLWNKLGATHAKMENHSRALEAYSRATALKPNFARGWLNAGLSYYKLKQSVDAAKCYLRALRIAPSASHVWSLLRIAFGQMERYDLVAKTEACNPEVFSSELGMRD